MSRSARDGLLAIPDRVPPLPELLRAQVEAAIEYAKIYPKKGRPYPARSFKRMAGDIGLKDVPIARSAKGPREIGQ